MNMSEIERPCIELEYCPYGWLVELFPLDGMPTTWNGKSLDLEPIVPKPDMTLTCEIFGHDCPIYYLFPIFPTSIEATTDALENNMSS